jgi:hypothetical protein
MNYWGGAGSLLSSRLAPGAEDSHSTGEVGGLEGGEDPGVQMVGPAGDVAGCGELGVGGGGSEGDGPGWTVVGRDQLRNGGDPARWVAGGGALEVDDCADATADQAADDVETGAWGGQGHGLEAGRDLIGAAGVERGHETAVAGVGGLEHVQDLRAPDLADDDAVGTHAKGVADQLAQRDLTSTLDVGWARLEPDDVGPGRDNSATSSMVTTRSLAGMAAARTLSSVILF